MGLNSYKGTSFHAHLSSLGPSQERYSSRRDYLKDLFAIEQGMSAPELQLAFWRHESTSNCCTVSEIDITQDSLIILPCQCPSTWQCSSLQAFERCPITGIFGSHSYRLATS